MTTHPTTLTTDDVHLLLEDARRRRLVRILAPLVRAETHRLAELVAAHEHPDHDEQFRRSVETSLEHIHLPMLEDFDVVERSNGAIEPTVLLDTLDAALDELEHETTRGDAHA